MQTMGTKRLLTAAGIAGSLLFWGTTANALTVSIGLQETGFASLSGTSLAPSATGDGVASFSGQYGDFSNNITALGIIGPDTNDTDLLTSTSINTQNTSGSSKTLTVYVTETGLSKAGNVTFVSQMATNLGGSLVEEQAWIGTTAFDLAFQLADHTFTNIDDYVSSILHDPPSFSLTEVFILDLGPSQSATSSIDVSTTPVPAALPLFGSVLGGGLMLRRWRKRKA